MTSNPLRGSSRPRKTTWYGRRAPVAEKDPASIALGMVTTSSTRAATALAATELPLAFLTTGHRIPDDLQVASPRALAALLLRSGFRSLARQESPR